MKMSKCNIGLAPSRNYDKVTLEILEEPIEYETDEELKAKIRRIFTLLRAEVNLQFELLQGKNNGK